MALWDSLAGSTDTDRTAFVAPDLTIRVRDLAAASLLPDALESLRGKSVLLATHDQIFAAVALLELDGIASRIVLCTPDLDTAQLRAVAATAAVDAILSERAIDDASVPGAARHLLNRIPLPASPDRRASLETEWILLTSGTTGTPKLVVHSLKSLGGTLPRHSPPGAVWSTFYDIRRYGGLQIYLRAVLGRAPLVLSSPGEPTSVFLSRAAASGVTHISGTPSHWRRALMSGACRVLRPSYVRLSGEIADQAVLDQLHAAYPDAKVAHAFASTEAGVGFDVEDGRAGFPASILDRTGNDVELKVIDGSLRIRSHRNAVRYLGAAQPLRDAEGFVDTGDLVELEQGRYYFRGRRGGIINVGGLKVYPEEVESVLNADPRVRMSRVRARRNPITGSLVVAEVVLAHDAAAPSDPAAAEPIKAELIDRCRRMLAAHKVPTMLRFVASLEVTAAGKMVRSDA